MVVFVVLVFFIVVFDFCIEKVVLEVCNVVVIVVDMLCFDYFSGYGYD